MGFHTHSNLVLDNSDREIILKYIFRFHFTNTLKGYSQINQFFYNNTNLLKKVRIKEVNN